MIEFDICAKDCVKLHLLSEVTNHSVNFVTFVESDGKEINFAQIRNNTGAYRLNNFSVTEDTAKDTITFKPVVIGCYAYFKINTPCTFQVEVQKKDGSLFKEFVLEPGENKVEFVPIGAMRYNVKITEPMPGTIEEAREQVNEVATKVNVANSSILEEVDKRKALEGELKQLQEKEAALLQHITMLTQTKNKLEHSLREKENESIALTEETRQLEEKLQALDTKKQHMVTHLNALQAEYDKDYAQFEKDLEEIKAGYTVDEEILQIYADREVTPAETLFENAKNSISQIENQIRIFVEAKQKKTAQIEAELKIGKKE